MRPVPALQSGDRGRTALTGKGMALSERGIEALARPLEQRTRRPQRQAEDDRTTAKEEDGVLWHQHPPPIPVVPGAGVLFAASVRTIQVECRGVVDRGQRRPVAWLGRALRG